MTRAAILGNIEQTMFGEPLYESREERAAHLFCFMIKNHPFSNGNKRSGTFLFLLYLLTARKHAFDTGRKWTHRADVVDCRE